MKKYAGLLVLAAVCVLGIGLYLGLNRMDGGMGAEDESPDFEALGEEAVIDKTADRDEFIFAAAALTKAYDKNVDLEKAAEEPYYSRRLIVKAKKKTDLSGYGAEKVIYGPEFISVMQFGTKEKAEAALKELEKLSQISYCQADRYVSIQGEEASKDQPVETAEHMSWGVAVTGADEYAKRVGEYSDGEVTVAVVDTGVYAHSFLEGRLLSGGIDCVEGDFEPEDLSGHGTHVAGTVVDCTPGLEVNILPVRVLDRNNNGTTFFVGMGIRYAADHGAKVINLSLSGSGKQIFVEACIKYAMSKGAVVVAAAGNENDDTANYTPSHMKQCIVVSAVDENMDRYADSNYGQSVDVTAPGVGVKSCVPKLFFGHIIGETTKIMKGTSMAVPHVSAIAAMMVLEKPSRTPAEIEKLVKKAAVDLGEEGWDPWFGYGIPNVGTNIPSKDQEEAFDKGVYDDILTQYRTAAEQRFEYDVVKGLEYVNLGTVNFRNHDKFQLVYQYMDLAEDGELELIIGLIADKRPYVIMDIYGVQDGTPVRLTKSHLSVGYRTEYYICKDKMIREYGTGGGLNVSYTYYAVQPYSGEWAMDHTYTYDGWNESQPYSYTDEYGIVTYINEEQYRDGISDEHIDYGLEWEVLYEKNSL